jgi:hypothetical protein
MGGDVMYYILKKHYYHNNTLYAPKDGPMKDTRGKKITFESLDEARSFLALIDVDTQLTQQTYTTSLAHYQIRRSRGTKKKLSRLIDELIDVLEYVIDDGYYYEGANQLLSALREVRDES